MIVSVPGYQIMRDYLAQCSINYSCITVYKYMKELCLRSVVRRKKPDFVKATVHKAFPNLLNQNFKVDVPNKIWCTDFTYLPKKDKIMRYNCTILIYMIWQHYITAELVITTLTIDLKRHKQKKVLFFTATKEASLHQGISIFSARKIICCKS